MPTERGRWRHRSIVRTDEAHVAEQRLPDVTVSIDETRHHDGTGGFHHLCIACPEVLADLGDAIPVDENVRLGVVRRPGPEGEDGAPADEGPRAQDPALAPRTREREPISASGTPINATELG